MNQEKFEFKARIEEYGLRMPEGKTPFVIIKFAYQTEGGEANINYLGSLSEKARPYTIERLGSIGYKGKLQSYEEIAEWIEQQAEIQVDDITIVLANDEYNGKTRLKVQYFWGTPKELTEEERGALAMQIFNFVNKKGGKPKPPAKAPAKPAAKPKPKHKPNSVADMFDQSEKLADLSEEPDLFG